MKVFVNREVREIFGPRRNKITRNWRKLHNEDLHKLCSSPCILTMVKLRSMSLADHVVRMEDNMNAYMLLVGEPEGK